MSNPILSIIIPVYNGELYLVECLDNIFKQDLIPNSFEVICVDDCSKDNSVQIISNYQKSFPNLKLIQHSTNLYLGSACNSGLRSAIGEYVWIIDQDDKIAENCIDTLINSCVENSLDVFLFNYRRIDEDGNILDSPLVFTNSRVLNGKAYLDKYFKNNFCDYLLGYRWRALYKKEFLVINNIKFQERAIFDDSVFLFKSILLAKRVLSVESFFYNYKINQNSITSSFANEIRALHIYHFAFVAGSEVYEFSEELMSIDMHYAKILNKKSVWYFNSFALKLVRTSLKEKVKFFSIIKVNSDLVRDKYTYITTFNRLLLNPNFGLIISIVVSRIYSFKKKFNK